MQNKIENETQITVFDNFADGNIEVLFQDEVKLDVEVSLFYIKSGQEEIQYYVDNTSIPQIESFTVTKIEDIKENINSYIEETTTPEIGEYVETEIIPSLDEYKLQTAADVQAASANALAAEQSASSALSNANSAALSAQEAEAAAQEAIEKSSFGNIGDIKYTMRTDVPNGGAWCDGTEYTQAMFPDIYQMLVDGKISSTDFTTFDDSVTNNGSCGFFALDTATTSFKVPLLKDVYIKAGDAPAMFVAESLPNIRGESGIADRSGKNGSRSSGAFYWEKFSPSGYAPGSDNDSSNAKFDASRSSSTYQDGAKVNPDHVVYRAYVVLYSSAAEASEAQAAEFINALANKVSKTGDETIEGVKTFIENIITNGVIPTTDRSNKAATTNWVKNFVKADNVGSRYVYIGKLLIQWNAQDTLNRTITLPKPYASTNYCVVGVGNSISGVGGQSVSKTTTSFTTASAIKDTFSRCWMTIGEGA